MSKYIFAFRVKDNDRDSCKYIESTYHLDCDDEVILHGACFCGRWNCTTNYDEVDTILSEQDFNCLLSRDITEQEYNRIVNILTSDEGIAFYNEIIESENEYLMEEYSLSEDDIQTIHDTYYLDYMDRGIVGYVFDDAYEAGQEYVESCYTVPDYLSNYIDYEKFGEDLCNDDGYFMLIEEHQEPMTYIASGDFLKEVKYILHDAVEIANYIDNFKEKQIDIFKDYVSFLNEQIEEQKEQDEKEEKAFTDKYTGFISDLTETIEAMIRDSGCTLAEARRIINKSFDSITLDGITKANTQVG